MGQCVPQTLTRECSMSSRPQAPAAHLPSLLSPLLTGAAATVPSLAGFQPIGGEADCPGCNPSEIPQTMDQLSTLISHSYDLTVRRAGELNIPIAGSVSGGFERRVVVYEWTRYKEIDGSGGIKCHYGFVIRFCLTINKWDAKAKLTLPFLSAQAELGQLEASWLMQVRGLVGPKINEVVLPPRELKVETFVVAIQSLEAAIKAINDPTTQFRSGILLARISPAAPDTDYWRSAVKSFAIDSVRRGKKRMDAQARLSSTDPVDVDLLSEAYSYFGIVDPTVDPGPGAREQAERLLRGIRVDK